MLEAVVLPPVLPMLLPVPVVFAVLVVLPVYVELTAELLLAVVPVPVELFLFFDCAELPVLLAPVDVLGLVYLELTAELLRGEVVVEVLVVLVVVELVLLLLELEEEPPNQLEMVVERGVVQKLMFPVSSWISSVLSVLVCGSVKGSIYERLNGSVTEFEACLRTEGNLDVTAREGPSVLANSVVLPLSSEVEVEDSLRESGLIDSLIQGAVSDIIHVHELDTVRDSAEKTNTGWHNETTADWLDVENTTFQKCGGRYIKYADKISTCRDFFFNGIDLWLCNCAEVFPILCKELCLGAEALNDSHSTRSVCDSQAFGGLLCKLNMELKVGVCDCDNIAFVQVKDKFISAGLFICKGLVCNVERAVCLSLADTCVQKCKVHSGKSVMFAVGIAEELNVSDCSQGSGNGAGDGRPGFIYGCNAKLERVSIVDRCTCKVEGLGVVVNLLRVSAVFYSHAEASLLADFVYENFSDCYNACPDNERQSNLKKRNFCRINCGVENVCHFFFSYGQ